jgi:hypothetical protein
MKKKIITLIGLTLLGHSLLAGGDNGKPGIFQELEELRNIIRAERIKLEKEWEESQKQDREAKENADRLARVEAEIGQKVQASSEEVAARIQKVVEEVRNVPNLPWQAVLKIVRAARIQAQENIRQDEESRELAQKLVRIEEDIAQRTKGASEDAAARISRVLKEVREAQKR